MTPVTLTIDEQIRLKEKELQQLEKEMTLKDQALSQKPLPSVFGKPTSFNKEPEPTAQTLRKAQYYSTAPWATYQ